MSKEREISRRDFLKLASLGTVGFIAGGCCAVSRQETPPEKTPEPPMKPTPNIIKPSSTETKEIKKGILWSQELFIPPAPEHFRTIFPEPEVFFTTQDKLFLATPEGYPTAFNLATGKKLWQWEERGTVYGSELETVYVVRSDKRLYALDAQTGQTKWRVIPGVDNNIDVGWPLMIGKQTMHLPFIDKGYFAEFSYLLSIDKKTGQVLWWEDSPNLKRYIQSESTIVIDRTNTYGCGYNCNLVGIDPTTGNEKWVLHPDPSGIFVISQDLSHLFYLKDLNPGFGLDQMYLLTAVDLDSGKEVWCAYKGEEDLRRYYDIISVSQKMVYALCSTNPKWPEPQYLSVLDRQTGEELWRGPETTHITQTIIKESVQGWNFLGEIEGMVILSNENLGYTSAFNLTGGETRWNNDDLRINRLVGTSNNVLVAVYNDPNSSPSLFGINLTTGQRQWRLELPHPSHKAIIFHDKIVYGEGQSLVVIDPETGAISSTIPLSDKPTRLVPEKDFLFAQYGQELSAVLI